MKGFAEKLIGRLEEETIKNKEVLKLLNEQGFKFISIKKAIEIVNELAEEYEETNIITDFLQYIRDNADNYDADNGWSLSDLIDLSIKFCDENEHNNDFCEWKFEENNGIAWHCENEKCSTYNNSYIQNLRIILEDFECKCPYCGKKIKVVE